MRDEDLGAAVAVALIAIIIASAVFLRDCDNGVNKDATCSKVCDPYAVLYCYDHAVVCRDGKAKQKVRYIK